MVLLYDGTCGFCDASVKFVLRHDRQGTMKFAALQGVYGTELLARHPELEGVDSVILVNEADDSVQFRSEAALAIAAYLGGVYRLAAIGRIVPRVVRDAAYDLFARHRYRFFGRVDACEVPSPALRERFLK